MKNQVWMREISTESIRVIRWFDDFSNERENLIYITLSFYFLFFFVFRSQQNQEKKQNEKRKLKSTVI